MNRRLAFAVLVGIFIVGALLWSTIVRGPGNGADAKQAVRSTVTEFGEQLQSVSLLASEEELQRQIQAAYAPYVSGELLAAWLDDPIAAPGRLTSSPWPDRIEITSVDSRERAYAVSGAIVLMTSVEATSAEDDNAGIRPVAMTVADVDGEWLITSFKSQPAKRSDEATYGGPENAFHVTYPREAYIVFGPGQEELVRAGHYIPPCEDGFAVCISYKADTFTGTNFGSAGIGIFAADAANRQACESTEYGALRRNVHGESINGEEFTVFESGTAAMSHVASDTVYLTWHDDSCYQLVTRIAYSRFEVYEPGTIDKFTDEAMDRLREDLHAVVSTFEFPTASVQR